MVNCNKIFMIQVIKKVFVLFSTSTQESTLFNKYTCHTLEIDGFC